MAYVNVADWKPDQVTDWLKGLDSCILQYIHSFLNNQVNGQQLLTITYDDLERLGVIKLGHQELILEAVEHLQNFHYELDRETLQLLALRLSCLAHSLYNELRHNHCNSHLVSTQTLSDVANIVTAVKPLVCWLDRAPFSGHLEYSMLKPELLSLSLKMATSGQRDRFAEHPVEEIKSSCGKLAALADSIIQDTKDPLLLQPASLDLATLKKRSSDDLGFYIVPSFQGIHEIGELKLNSAAHQCGKIEPGDEIVQINYQTVVGWQVKQVMALFEESPTEVLLTIKKRPKHTKVYGQIYMKPYRLPSKKKTQRSYTRWHENIPSPRPELLTIPDFEMPLPKSVGVSSVESTATDVGVTHLPSSSSEEEVEGVLGTNSSPTSVRIYLPKPRIPVQRRATITGASPISKTAPIDLQQFWQELKLEREWRGGGSVQEGTDKLARSQLIQDCEEAQLQLSQLSPRKYSSFDSLKTKPDLVSSCQMMFNRNCRKSTESIHDEVFKTSENSPRKKSSDSDEVFRTPDSSGMVSKKSSVSDDVFTVIDNNNICIKLTDDTNKNNNNNNGNLDNDSNECRKISLKERIEMFSKGCQPPGLNSDKMRSYSAGNSRNINDINGTNNCNKISVKPKVPARTFRLSPEKTASSLPQVVARVINDKNESITSNINNNNNNNNNSNSCSNNKNSNNDISNEKIFKTKERGRLDKSHSTPAYDFNIDININQHIEKNKQMAVNNKSVSSNSQCSSSDDRNATAVSVTGKTDGSVTKEVHGQMVETINLHLLKMNNDESYPINDEIAVVHPDMNTSTPVKDENTDDNYNQIEENEKTEKIGKLLETISSSIAKHRRKELGNDNNLNPKTPVNCDTDGKSSDSSIDNGGADLSKTILQVCQEEILQTYNPSNKIRDTCYHDNCAKSNSNSNTNKGGVLPVPPRVRVTPPVLPDVTMTTCSVSLPVVATTPPEMPKRKPVSNMEFIDTRTRPTAPATFPRHQKPETQRPISPPEPPPRPTPPRGACYRAMLAAKSMAGKSTGSAVASPRALRKRNPLLAKMRNVTVAELGACECEGWLQQRCRKGSGLWNTGWFVIKGTTFYGFANKESQKAMCLISLPGFTVSPAEEVKSRKFAFKVYHTGTIFYFAANTQEELTTWLDCFSMATVIQDTLADSVLFSESEGEATADEMENESCFRSPKMKKMAGFLSGAPSSPSSARSHQNLTTDGNSKGKSETQKKFSSLKKFGSRKPSSSSTSSMNTGGGGGNDVPVDNSASVSVETTTTTNSSLDRKYLRFLDRGQIRPVPTAQFRSYRRVAPPLPRQHQHPHPLHQSAESVLTLDSGGGGNEGVSSSAVPSQPTHIIPPGTHHPHHHLHHRPPDMADYRLASLSKNRQRAVEDHDTTGFITLEALMLARQEEEHRQSVALTPGAPPPVPQPRSSTFPQGGNHHQQQHQHQSSTSVVQQRSNSSAAMTNLHSPHGQHHQMTRASNSNSSMLSRTTCSSLASSSSSRNLSNIYNGTNNSNNNNTYPMRSTSTGRGGCGGKDDAGGSGGGGGGNEPTRPIRSIFSGRFHTKQPTNVDYRDGSPEKLWIDSLRANTNNNNNNSKRLKKAALYQPPPVAPLDTAGVSSDDSRMQLAFEMFLDQNQLPLGDGNNQSRRRSGRCSNIQTPASRLKNLFTGGGHSNSPGTDKHDNQKTLLGSPRLHRAIFRNSSSSSRCGNGAGVSYIGCSSGGGNADSGGESLNSPPLSPPDDIDTSLQNIMHSPSTPDYPGLEYPPVFEPGTYSLSDASSLYSSSRSSTKNNNNSTANNNHRDIR